MNQQEREAVLALAVLAAGADGARVEAESAEIEAIAAGLASTLPGAVDRGRMPELTRALLSPRAREQAYETAVAVCDADGSLTGPEREFLAGLAAELGLARERRAEIERRAGALVVEPIAAEPAPADAAGLDALIRRTAILCAALELLPQGLASLAVVPLQMRMVYAIGKRHGYELDSGHLKDFLAAAGVGLSSQVLEGLARRVVGGLLGRLGGGFLRGLGGQATGSAFTFATTWALGRVAERYYAGGRKLSGAQLREAFGALVGEARGLADREAGDIRARAASLDVGDLASLVARR